MMRMATMSPVERVPRLPRHQRGVTMVEALVTFVILSVGLLGAATLQTLAKSGQHEVLQRSRAITLGNDLVERIRANPAGMDVYSARGRGNGLGRGSQVADTIKDCRAAGEHCNPSEFARYNLDVWQRQLDGESGGPPGGGPPGGGPPGGEPPGQQRKQGGLRAPSACILFTADAGKQHTGMVNVVVEWEALGRSREVLLQSESLCDEPPGNGNGNADPRYLHRVVVRTYVIDESE